jgi:hypothetical protein
MHPLSFIRGYSIHHLSADIIIIPASATPGSRSMHTPTPAYASPRRWGVHTTTSPRRHHLVFVAVVTARTFSLCFVVNERTFPACLYQTSHTYSCPPLSLTLLPSRLAHLIVLIDLSSTHAEAVDCPLKCCRGDPRRKSLRTRKRGRTFHMILVAGLTAYLGSLGD